MEIRPIPVRGIGGPLPAAKRLRITGGRSDMLLLSTFLPPGGTGRLAVEVRVRAGSGALYATRYLRAHGTHGPLTTLLGLQGADQEVSRALVGHDPLAGSNR